MIPTFGGKHKPSAPQLDYLTLSRDGGGVYGDEEGCDVVFLVGQEEPWRIPVHKTILQNATPVFEAMFSHNFYHPQENGDGVQTIPVTDVKPQGMDNLLKYLYAQEVAFQSVNTALSTLYAAHKYQCPELVKKCVDYLKVNVAVSNVLMILRHVTFLCGNVQNLENLGRERQMLEEGVLGPSRRNNNMILDGDNLFVQTVDSSYLDSIEIECASLVYACLLFVDKEAATVLQLDEMDELEVDTFQTILSRDTLDTDEIIVFKAVNKWADKECKRQQLPLTMESKRNILGDCVYLPRYLTMTLPCFQCDRGPAKSGLLTKEQVQWFTSILQEDGKTVKILVEHCCETPNSGLVPWNIQPYFRQMASPRCPLSRNEDQVSGSPAKKPKKGLGFIQKFTHRRCCRRKSHSSSPSNSNSSSPIRDPTAMSPTHTNDHKKWNICVERMVVFLACLFD